MKNWEVAFKYPGSSSKGLLIKILEARDIKSKDQLSEFLKPLHPLKYKSELSETFLKSLQTASSLINECISKQMQIIIYGDYDADGVCATSILYNTIVNELKYDNVMPFIPSRFEHGYGLSKKAILEIQTKLNNKNALFITVDSGITSAKEVEYLKSKNHKVIITDHHQKPKDVPKPDILVWEDKLVGSGVAYFLAKELGSKDDTNLAYAAIATVTDIYKLIGINRSIVVHGLKVLNKNPPLGIQSLLSQLDYKNKNITSYDLGWGIGPRLNATGRMMDAKTSFRLLTSDNKNTSQKLAKNIIDVNLERQNQTEKMYEHINIDKSNLPSIIISASEKYHEGIIGLIASRVVQQFYRPCVVISLEGEIGKGSARSINGINIIELFRKFQDLFIDVGGHPMAAGFTIKSKNIPKLQKELTKYLTKNINPNVFVPTINVDAQISLSMATHTTYKTFSLLEPYGYGNSQPKFATNNLSVVSKNYLGSDKQHLKIRLYDKKTDRFINGISFNYAQNLQCTFDIGDKINVVYRISENTFNGKSDIELLIVDIKPCN